MTFPDPEIEEPHPVKGTSYSGNARAIIRPNLWGRKRSSKNSLHRLSARSPLRSDQRAAGASVTDAALKMTPLNDQEPDEAELLPVKRTGLWALPRPPNYISPLRNAAIGSIRMARRAGRNPATSAIPITARAVEISINGSDALT
jgi:hypothetical protein